MNKHRTFAQFYVNINLKCVPLPSMQLILVTETSNVKHTTFYFLTFEMSVDFQIV